MKRPFKKSFFLVLAVMLQACALTPLAVPVAVSGGAAGIGYTLTNVAYKTISHSDDEVEAALHKALKKMDIKETKREAGEGTIKITAKTAKLDIYVTLDKVTPKVTRMSVDAVESVVLKDKSTATEIIVQTEKALK